MVDVVEVTHVNETYMRVTCEPSIAYELNDYFTFDVPGAKFVPSYKNKMWDGKIRLYSVMTGMLYVGLLRYVEEFCTKRNYEVQYNSDFSADQFSVVEAQEFITALKPTKEPRDYQLDAFIHAVRERRSLLLSPTASGKSFIIYLLTRYYAARTLIIVPTTSLVSQLASDFADYGFDSEKFVHRVFAGQDKGSKKPITITTWQSVYKMPKEFFAQFEVVIGDEAHLFKAKSLTSIMGKLDQCRYRFGFTGTLDNTLTNKLVLEGLFGPVRKVISTSELIEKKYLADFKIKAIVLTYPDDVRKQMCRADYQAEMDYLVRLDARNKFILNLALSLEGNSLLLFQYVEKHGKQLYAALRRMTNRPVYYVAGSVDGEEREEIRKILETEPEAIIVASFGTFSTGVNIPSLRNLIFCSPSKSRVKILQSIGRVLRTSEGKLQAVLYDIADDMSWKNEKNFTLLHFMERIKTYNEEKFSYKLYKVSITI